MNFASDNVVGASPRVLQAIVDANEGAQGTYGADEHSRRSEAMLSEIFEREVQVFLVATGTAANSLAIASITPPWGGVLSHAASHASADECGAPEFFSGGAKMLPLHAVGCKPLAEHVDGFFAHEIFRPPHNVKPVGLSVSQATECGLVYAPEELAALGRSAKRNKLKFHLDGARFANGLVARNGSPADLTWRAGVDVMSFGATKNGCLSGEAVIFFNPALAEDFAYRRKRSGQLLSKGRLFGAQMAAYLENGHWLDLARHANAMAGELSRGLVGAGARLAWPTEANEVFAILPNALDAKLKAAGAVYYPWPADGLPPDAAPVGPDEILVRMIASFATRPEDVETFLAAA